MKKLEVAPRFSIATSINNSKDQTEKSEVTPQETMLNLISGFWVVRSIYLAAELGIADQFDDQPKTIDQIAAGTNTEPR